LVGAGNIQPADLGIASKTAGRTQPGATHIMYYFWYFADDSFVLPQMGQISLDLRM
jgi:hypothetical protein